MFEMFFLADGKGCCEPGCRRRRPGRRHENQDGGHGAEGVDGGRDIGVTLR